MITVASQASSNSISRRIAYIAPYRFPDDTAMSRRMLGIASTLKLLGHDVHIGAAQCDQATVETAYARSLPFSLHALCEWDKNSSILTKLIWCLLSGGANTLRWLKRLQPQPDVVLLYQGLVPYAMRILPYCRRNRIPVIVDVVEWYQPSHLPGGWMGPMHWNLELAMRHFYPQAMNIIAISSYLETYFSGRGCHVLRIPPTLDVRATQARLTSSEGPLNLAYAGVPGKKDLLNNVITALLRVDPEGHRVRLTIVGPSVDEILRSPALQSMGASTLPGCLKARGRLPHNDALVAICEADFVPLLRPPLRYAEAGFPTKVPESLAVGTPLICNITGDIGSYIRDGVDGIVCRDETSNAFEEALSRAMTMTIEQRTEMRRAARLRAEQSFDYRMHAQTLDRFLGNLR